jgi:hypothetical protein
LDQHYASWVEAAEVLRYEFSDATIAGDRGLPAHPADQANGLRSPQGNTLRFWFEAVEAMGPQGQLVG